MNTSEHNGFPDDILKTFENPIVNQAHYYYFNQGFTPDECNRIIETFKSVCENDATVFGDNVISARKTKVAWIPYNDTTKWIYDRILGMAASANNAMFKFHVTSLRDTIQFGMYDESFQGQYQRHIDIGENLNSQRKLSVSVQLSDPSNYEGGSLILKHTETPKCQGDVSVFPSFLEHEVTPVTKGTRYSLVLWIYGPHFR